MKSPVDPGIDLDDLRVFVVVASVGSMSKASKRLGMSVATVSRRVERLEEALHRKLFRRHPGGLSLTPESTELLEYGRGVMERVYDFLRASDVQPQAPLEGTVTVSTLESMVTRILVPSLGGFREKYPGIQLVLRSEQKMVNLSKRAADIAIRITRPTESRVVAQKVASFSYGLYASPDYIARKGRPAEPERDLSGHDIVTFDERFDTIPEVAWLHVRATEAELALRLSTAAAITAAVESGVGLGVLPNTAVRKDLVCLWTGPDLPEREIWMVMHEDLQQVPRVRAVFDYLRNVLVERMG